MVEASTMLCTISCLKLASNLIAFSAIGMDSIDTHIEGLKFKSAFQTRNENHHHSSE
jgi:tetrahydromethanopterin S-methyltransferase subunit F